MLNSVLLYELKVIGCVIAAMVLIYLVPVAVEAIVKLIKRIGGRKK